MFKHAVAAVTVAASLVGGGVHHYHATHTIKTAHVKTIHAKSLKMPKIKSITIKHK